MKKLEIMNRYSISEATLRNWKKLGYISSIEEIDVEDIERIIKSKKNVRRNKRNSTNHIIPTSYVKDKKIPHIITHIMDLQEAYHISNHELLIETIKKVLVDKRIPQEAFDLLGEGSNNEAFMKEFNEIIISYDESDDFLGCLYMSLLSQGKKDSKGIFYTPFSVVKKMVESVDVYENMKVLDPGCGSGNFLIQMFKKMKDNHFTTKEIIDSLYGYDIDDIAILIAKINLYNLDDNIDYNELNIRCEDYLLGDIQERFDVVIGNPPWGIKYTKKEKEELAQKYDKLFAKQDSFAQFIQRSFDLLNEDGVLSFVLPSSILNIAVHEDIRNYLLDYNINYIKNMGREFTEVVTDVIIMKVTKAKTLHHTCIYNRYKIEQDQFLENPHCNFLIPSAIPKNIIKKIKNTKYFCLDDKNSQFSLGIVTGNNKEYLHDTQIEGSEPIISGKEITRYNFDYSLIKNYIVFEKDKLQQVAPEENYRKEKLVYKFIGNKLCFAVETKGYLTLNSANIINIKYYDYYYVSAILNSRVTQLFFDEVYKTHKVLKSHIQSFCIFDFDEKTKEKIIELTKLNQENKYNEEIEDIIYKQLSLTEEEINYLREMY
ncbi:MAG: N-6 DNA methylase [Bacilli bacterium]|nr:N-6 DNA methylase [Bacilli bacterium]